MSEGEKTMTTAEFSRITGLAAATITKMLRRATLRGQKRGGKWAIFESELQKVATGAEVGQGNAAAALGAQGDRPTTEARPYEVAAFARLTYLTEKGVHLWLRTGRLTGHVDASGNAMVDAANLERPEIQHLIRK